MDTTPNRISREIIPQPLPTKAQSGHHPSTSRPPPHIVQQRRRLLGIPTMKHLFNEPQNIACCSPATATLAEVRSVIDEVSKQAHQAQYLLAIRLLSFSPRGG